jgi:hypothetical protein
MIFFPRVVNNIKTYFTEKELTLLSSGLKYNSKTPELDQNSNTGAT